MSGDVQPRKRKDKKRKKDELGVEEPRGTSAALGEGDVFMHSQHEHGTGGHWCAKIIFFSLLAVLITLIGLIILENRGLSDLEANSVESRYSGVLEGWLEDAPDDDHHDEHTLELKHHDDEDDHSPEIDDEHEEIDDHDEEDDEIDEHDEEDDEIDDHDEEDDDIDDHDEDDGQDDKDSEEIDDQYDDDDDNDKDNEDEIDQYEEDNEHDDTDDGIDDQHEEDDDKDEVDNQNDDKDNEDNIDGQDDDDVDEDAEADEADDDVEERNYDESNENGKDVGTEGDENDDLLGFDENDTTEADDKQNEEVNQSEENDYDTEFIEENSVETEENEEDESHEKEVEEELEVEVERLEKEISDEEALSDELPTTETKEDDKSEETDGEDAIDNDEVSEDEEFLEPDDIDEELPIVEHIVAPKGKPLVEVEEASTMKPADSLADEEEYEKQQEELKKEQEQASHVWLKLLVGGALLVATHAVVRRFTAPRDDTPASDEHGIREETPVIHRRMTLINEETVAAAVPKLVPVQITQPIVEEQILERVTSLSHSRPLPMEEHEEEEDEIESKDVITAEPSKQVDTDDKELFSDEEEPEDEEEEEEIVKDVVNIPKQTAPQQALKPKPEMDEDVPDDVEIIDDEQIEEELEEEDIEEEEISDVDDAELLSRLEAKYGRLPEPERPGQKQKDGGNSIEDDWPGEPSDQYWRRQLDQAEEELRQGDWRAASERAAAEQLKGSARARWVVARAIDAEAEARRDNRLLTRAITAYLDVLKMNDRLTDTRLLEVANRTLDRIRFRGNYLSAEPVYRLLIRRFPDVPDFHNNLTVSFLMANRADLAEQVIKETLQKWPDDRIALAHHGFVLKTQHNRHEEAVDAFQKALDGDTGPATESRFYYHLGDSLLLLGRYAEAHEVHKRGAAMGHFLSPSQRSLYNVERLKSQPWWNIEQTPYLKLARALEKSWKDILKEGEAAKASYEKEKEGLKERGEWSQLDLFVRGQEIPNRCKRAPVTCSIVRSEAAAAGCRRGQVKFSAMEAGTHVRPHVGPTNCRLRMHLGLSNTKDTYLRVDQETRQWKIGKTFMFDDSFEHEVWHNGTGSRLVLIVDVWHPALTAAERRSLPPI